MKVLYSCVLLLAICAAIHASSSSWGRKNGSDYLLSRQVEVRNPIKNSYSSVTIDFPRAGASNFYNITFVQCIDNFRNQSGASPSLWSGGPGFRFAQLNLRSQVGKGINTTVEIWGR